MDQSAFEQNLARAVAVLIPFVQEFVTNTLPSSYRCLIVPNGSYDGNPLVGDEEVFPGDSLLNGEYLGPFDATQAVRYLWRGGKVPEWINITVYACDQQHSYLEFLSCGRFTAMERHLYHKAEGYPPFHVLSPVFPPKWESVEANGKFDLFWRGDKAERYLLMPPRA